MRDINELLRMESYSNENESFRWVRGMYDTRSKYNDYYSSPSDYVASEIPYDNMGRSRDQAVSIPLQHHSYQSIIDSLEEVEIWKSVGY